MVTNWGQGSLLRSRIRAVLDTKALCTCSPRDQVGSMHRSHALPWLRTFGARIQVGYEALAPVLLWPEARQLLQSWARFQFLIPSTSKFSLLSLHRVTTGSSTSLHTLAASFIRFRDLVAKLSPFVRPATRTIWDSSSLLSRQHRSLKTSEFKDRH
jgi:hypothetical protein